MPSSRTSGWQRGRSRASDEDPDIEKKIVIENGSGVVVEPD